VMVALTPAGAASAVQNTSTTGLFQHCTAVLPGGIFKQVACYIGWIEVCRKPNSRENA
jgi:hypothetical protein